MTLIKVELLITKSSQQHFSTKKPALEVHLRVALVVDQRNSLRDSEPSSQQEEPEESLDLVNNSESWTTTTADHLISTNSPKQ